VLELPAEELAAMTDRLRPPPGMSISRLVHALHLFGPELMTPTGSLREGRASVLDVLLDVPRAAELFSGASILTATRYGLRAPLHEDALMGTDQSGSMAHRGQFLSVLGSLGVPSERPIRLGDGSSRPVAAIRDDLVANFSMAGEVAWDAVALAFYSDGPVWTNKFGREFSFDELAHELNSRDPGQAPCGGIHELIALTTILKVDQRRAILSPKARDRAVANLSRRVARVKTSQREDGSWGLRWHRAEPTEGPHQARASSLSSEDALIVTGHLLEWLILLPESLQPETGVYRRGATWLAAALKVADGEPSHVAEHYCPLIHATRSLRLLSRAVEPPRGE